jgi:hypothetical protein
VTVFERSSGSCTLSFSGTLGTLTVDSTVTTAGTVNWLIENSSHNGSGTTQGPAPPQNDNSQGQSNSQGQNTNN